MKNRHGKHNTGAFQLFELLRNSQIRSVVDLSNISLPVGQSSRILCHRCTTRHEDDKELEINNIPKLTRYPIITPYDRSLIISICNPHEAVQILLLPGKRREVIRKTTRETKCIQRREG